ncbi:TM0106 family RecB-like putative nuclease [Propionibacteriaceae bacterium Y1700]|uniref:TM0106 family RecB-like putative nuclease n=1 Tax=Microlunatus sp. Y1700 TaxID=3418487 RepID=UPI003DA71D73
MIRLDAYAARTCAVKTHNRFDPQVRLVEGPIDEALQELFDDANRFEASMLDELARVPGAVDLRGSSSLPVEERVAACRRAMESGASVIIDATLPADDHGHRTGRPDALVRAPYDSITGRPGYWPVDVKNHRVRDRRRPDTDTPPLVVAPLDEPVGHVVVETMRFRYGTREGDLLQVAHYWRMLLACGHAAGDGAWGGIIGNDPDHADLTGPVVAWVSLDDPVSRTFSRSAEQGWTRRSILARYDHEFAFRVDVAEVAVRQGEPDAPPPKVLPIRIDECRRCVWWEHCRTRLDSDDISLRLDKGPLDIREIGVLRQLGLSTVTELAQADLDQLLTRYLGEVSHRPNAEARLRTAHRRAVMLARGELLERITAGMIRMPMAEVEIDFDLEAADSGRVYLWGFLVNDAQGSRYVDFTAWEDLDDAGEVALAVRALSWLREMINEHGALVYHYSGYELNQIERLAQLGDHDVLDWAASPACRQQLIDLYEVVKTHWFGVQGLGLKQVATAGAGFAWRDDDPNGLASQAWFREAVGGSDERARADAMQRVLTYNEDDVIATREVRRWLREQH